jgi:hypothetical protein
MVCFMRIALSDNQSNLYSREALLAANINPDTWLATDYLNHFNEMIMLVEMLADVPEIAADIGAWEPKSYADHFRDSSFAAKELAISAYENAPSGYRVPFDAVIQQIENYLIDIQTLVSSQPEGDPIDLSVQDYISDLLSNEVRPLIDKASGLIHGHQDHAEEDAILAQNTINALFE